MQGVLSPADPGVLEGVAERRVANDWNLSSDYTAYDVLVAPSDCQLLDRDGWLIVDGKILTAKVVDCEADVHKGQMQARGLMADVNLGEVSNGWLILKEEVVSRR